MTHQRPNILWICTDQQRYDTIGALGSAHAQTPHMDRLVGAGVPSTERIVRARFATEPSLVSHRPLCTHDKMPTKRPANPKGGTLAEPAFCRSLLFVDWRANYTYRAAPTEKWNNASKMVTRSFIGLIIHNPTGPKTPIPNGWQRRGFAGRISTMVRPLLTSRKAFPLLPPNNLVR